MTIPLSAQSAAVERAAINWSGYCDTLSDLVARGKRPKHELETARGWIPALNAAAKTMQWMVANEARIKAAAGDMGSAA